MKKGSIWKILRTGTNYPEPLWTLILLDDDITQLSKDSIHLSKCICQSTNPTNCKYNCIVIEMSVTIFSWNMILGFECCVDHPSTSTLMCNDRVSFPWEIWKIPVKPVLKISIILAKRMCNIRNLILPYDQYIFTYSIIAYSFLC